MVENQNSLNSCEEALAHHGILGMKWGIRRYQPYPSGYSGEGEYVGKRKSARAERREARHKAKVNTKIRNAVSVGDKKKLKKYKDEMSPEEFEKKYSETVRNGINNAVKDRDKSALKKYKDDLSEREYKHEKDRIDFKNAVDNDNSRKIDKLMSRVNPEDVAEATELIRNKVNLQNQKLQKIRQDSELMAKMDKLSSGVNKISNITRNVANITQAVGDMSAGVTKLSQAAKDADEKEKKKQIERVVKSGDIKLIEKNKDKMSLSELKDAYERVYVNHQKEVDDAISSGDRDKIKEVIPYMDNKNLSGALAKLKSLDGLGGDSTSKKDSGKKTVEEVKKDPATSTIRTFVDGDTFMAQSASKVTVKEMNDYLGGRSVNGEIKSVFGAAKPRSSIIGEDKSFADIYDLLHSDDFTFEDVLAHHGILGMKWGIRRFQPYPKGYHGDGKEVGKAKRVGLGDRKYQNYDVSYAKAGSQYRKKTKYTNIDGSLNEKGKLHAQKYISKQIDKNNKYYAKEIAKYEKKAEKYEDNPEMHKKFLDMAADAKRSRDSVNESIKSMAIDEIMTNESIENAKVMKAIKTAAGITVGAATGGAILGAGIGIANGIKGTEQEAMIRRDVKTAFDNFDIRTPMDSAMYIANNTTLGKKAEEFVEGTIRTYSDARAYVLGIGLDQAMYRLNTMGVPQTVGKTIGAGGKTALNEMGFTPSTISDLNNLVTNSGSAVNSVINNPNTANLINEVLANPNLNQNVNSAMNYASNVQIPTTYNPNLPLNGETLTVKNTIDEIMSNPDVRNASRRAYIKAQPNNIPLSEQKRMARENVG